jgi:hypothetical protein
MDLIALHIDYHPAFLVTSEDRMPQHNNVILVPADAQHCSINYATTIFLGMSYVIDIIGVSVLPQFETIIAGYRPAT